MAKIVKLTQSGKQVYPQSITEAIADIAMGKKLSTILSEFAAQFTALDGKIGGINVVKDSALKYHVEDSEGNQIGAAIEIAQDTFLDDVNLVEDYNEDGPALHFTFNAASGKQEIYVPVKKLVDVYNGDDTTIVKNGSTFSVKDGVFASAAQGAKADTALQTIENGTDGDYVDLVISAKGEGETKQTLTVSLTIQAVETASETSKGLAEAKDVKDYVDGAVSGANESLSQAIQDEADRADAAEKANKALIEAEAKRADEAEKANAQAISDEKSRAEGVESGLDTRLTSAEGTIASHTTSISENATAISTEKTRAEEAEAANAAAVVAEKERAEGAEGTLTTNLAAEVERATAAEEANAAAIVEIQTAIDGGICAEALSDTDYPDVTNIILGTTEPAEPGE